MSGFWPMWGKAASAAGLLAACCLSLAAWAQTPCTDAVCAGAALADSPLRGLAYWGGALQRPMDQRLGAGSAALVGYLALDNLASGLRDRPQAVVPEASFMADLKAVIDGLPAVIQTQLQSRLLGIYLVGHLGSTGYTEQVADASGRPVAGFIVLDPGTLNQRTANQWATWKESSPFQASSVYRLRAEIEPPADDNRRNALQYILLHEIGHVLSIGSGLTPSWDDAPAGLGPLDRYRFTRLSWQVGPAGQWQLRDEAGFPQRRDIVYYRHPRLPAAAMVPVYTRLAASDFPTLYAVTNPFDDFAEAFASYVHVVMLHKPYAIRLYQHGHMRLAYGPCWGLPRCAAKAAVLRQLLHTN